MSDGAGNGSALWQAQSELARQVSQNSERIGHVTAQLADRPTYKDMMTEMNGARKEITGKIDHMETKFDLATTKLEGIFDGTIKRLQDTWETVADRAVAKELAKREVQETRAREAVKRNDEEMERKIRNANRNGALGVGTGAVGLLVFIAERLGAFG